MNLHFPRALEPTRDPPVERPFGCFIENGFVARVRACMGRLLERLYIDNCLPLTVELFHQLAFFILSCKPISYCRFKRFDVYILQSVKPNAISGHARLA